MAYISREAGKGGIQTRRRGGAGEAVPRGLAEVMEGEIENDTFRFGRDSIRATMMAIGGGRRILMELHDRSQGV